jgi:multicomponent Na+:H+ antiporter subunit D
MVGGILLSVCGGIDELRLRGEGRALWPAGLVMAAGALLLAGLPVGLMGQGSGFIESAASEEKVRWVSVVIAVGAACTGGAVLRVAGRVFLGLGKVAGLEADAPTDEDSEKGDRPLWLMLAPAAFLLIVASIKPPLAVLEPLERALGGFMHPQNQAVLAGVPSPGFAAARLHAPGTTATPWVSLLSSVLIAAIGLGRGALPLSVLRLWDTLTATPLRVAQHLHSGTVGDYLAWTVAGIALLAVPFAWL